MSIKQLRSAALLLFSVSVVGCADEPTAPPAVSRPAQAVTPFPGELLSTQWQQLARSLVAANSPSPVAAGRTYAALSIAQYRAVLAVDGNGGEDGVQPDEGLGGLGRSQYERRRGAVSGASLKVLGFLFPGAASTLERQVQADANAGPGNPHPSFARGLELGMSAGAAMVDHLKNDGSSVPWQGTIPVGPGYWTANGPPVGANLGGVKPYLLNSTAQFRSAPPPQFGSPAFQTDLNEVLTFAQNRTAQQVALSLFWAFLGATPSPLGIWNELASNYIEDANLDERAATHVFALTHAAQFDAQLGCFESKYFYFYIRPSQAQPLIPLLFPVPNHPSYPSGHSCISSSAARVLEHFFPARAAELANHVTDAGLARIYPGIHYRFDVNAGRILGTAVADWAISHEQALR